MTALGWPIWVIGTVSDNNDDDILLSSLQVTRAIYELLLISSQRSEVQTFFASVFVALLFQISFLVTSGSTVTQDELREIEYVDPVRYLGFWAHVLRTMTCISASWHLRLGLVLSSTLNFITHI